MKTEMMMLLMMWERNKVRRMVNVWLVKVKGIQIIRGRNWWLMSMM